MKIKRISSAKTSETAIHFHRTSEVDNNDYRTKHRKIYDDTIVSGVVERKQSVKYSLSSYEK